MHRKNHPTAVGGIVAAVFAVLGGCTTRTNVSATGNTPAQYSHVYVTAQAVWFNTNASSGPDDTDWSKFSLTEPVTVDLTASSDATLATIVTGLKLTPGTYRQVRLLLVDPDTSATPAASSAGALYNAEADYVDASGTSHQVKIELLNADKGIAIPISLTIPIGNLSTFSSANTTTGSTSTFGTFGTTSPSATTSPTTTPSTSLTTTTMGSTNLTSPTVTPVPSSTTISPGLFGSASSSSSSSSSNSSSSSSNTTVSAPVYLDGQRDLAMFTYANNTGVLLNPHATGYDAAKAGAITGTLTLTQVSNDTSASGRVKIQVTAETLSADGLHHIVVTSAPVRSDGTFALYPLATTSSASNSSSSSSSSGSSGSSNSSGSASSNASSATGSSSMSSSATSSLANNSSSASSSSGGTPYDVVIHGPTIATIIIRDIRVVAGDPSTTTPVSIGTLTPRQATSYSVDVTPTSTATLPAGTLVGFYQTLPGAGEKPYVIEEMPIDPFNRTLATPTPLSQATIDLGTYHSSGSTITVTGSTPVEGAGGYRVAGTAPLFSDEDVTINPVHVSAPSSTTTAPVQVTVPPPAFASGSVADSITATVAQAAPGTYNQGEIIVSHDGAVVATAPLDSILTQPGGGTAVLTGVPGGTSTAAFASALYYLSVRVWNSSNPGGTVHRQSYDMPVDLRNGSASGIVIAIN